MTIELNVTTIITFSAFLAALVAIITLFAKGVRFVDRQKQQDKDIQEIKAEQTILTYGVLACLKGLAEQGCDGPVHEAIDQIEKYLNQKAHK